MRPRYEGIPWETAARGGWLDRLVETTRRVLTAPAAFFRAMPTTGGLVPPLAYALILGSLGAWVGLVYDSVFREAISAWVPMLRERYTHFLPFAGQLASTLIGAVLAPVFVVAQVFIISGLVHLMLMLVGGARRGFETTFRVASYSMAPAVLTLVPFCGGLVAWVWGLVLMIVGLSEAHGTTKGIAAAGVLLPIVLVCCACSGFGILVGMTLPGILSGWPR